MSTSDSDRKRTCNLSLIWAWALDTEGYPGRALSTFHRDCEYLDRGEEGFNQPTIACCLAWAERFKAVSPDLHPATIEESLEAAEVFQNLATKLYDI